MKSKFDPNVKIVTSCRHLQEEYAQAGEPLKLCLACGANLVDITKLRNNYRVLDEAIMSLPTLVRVLWIEKRLLQRWLRLMELLKIGGKNE